MSASHLEFHPLTFVQDRDGVTVGRFDVESYAVLPEDGAALLRRLFDGMPVAEAAAWYEAEFGEPIDMADFVEALRELEFLREDGEVVEVAPVRYRALGRAAFSPPAWLGYAALVTAAVLVMVARPELRPHGSSVFFTPSLVAVQVVLTFTQVPAVLFHEWFHVLAGRRLGVPSKLNVSRRLYFIVFETELNGLLSVPKSKRYLPFLAGVVADVLLFSALTLVAAVDDSAWGGRLALAIAYLVLLRLVWQSYLFLRTDLYYVLTTMAGCTNLHEAASAYLRNRFHRLPFVRKSTVDDSAFAPRDRQLAPWFALTSVAGVVFLLVTVLLAIVPVVLEFGARLWTALSGGTAGGAGFWDSAVAVLLIVVQLVLLTLVTDRRTDRTST
ncbi:hypothetical protein [Umezawaea tangerina]|uniref:Peptide zinc metalloprotease protein n=1 Tax=Umezawaea tangerina TaxID=84725 RepID=A0A2T0THH7_9PSEU|nr:hypothetical protein [Umezawaea tangerina]PRY45147.1 hypothetical protein CLV43_102712 [Umezawaea tangerina]